MSKHEELRVRVVHGNTLTAAVILNDVPKDVKEVFLTGATSKLGRAIALYLCQKKVRVLVSPRIKLPLIEPRFPYISTCDFDLMILRFLQMLTLSTERFQKIQKEAPLDCQSYLVQVTKYQAARNCKASPFFPGKKMGKRKIISLI